MTQALTDRVNSLDLSADLQRKVWEMPLCSVEVLNELRRRIHQELMIIVEMRTRIRNRCRRSRCSRHRYSNKSGSQSRHT
ncbi:hypothetical protein C0Q70_17897 [Pomacea canaliculata]|uniref:Uncharacterized protein n=1 Tax=Pomacea canaliculata TaxID=400727 RepID=A0A2T7NLP7_POMCA|nr:hypothetical protein C0Q70_17897 [Pomacea canaliculata]